MAGYTSYKMEDGYPGEVVLSSVEYGPKLQA